MSEIVLKGCTPAPLAHYLKALGILRLVAEDVEHGDPQVRGCWRGEHFVLESRLDEAGLRTFFLEHYQPTPVISPWNGRAGYLEGEDGEESTRGGAQTLAKFRNSCAPRLIRYRSIIDAFDALPLLARLNTIRARRKQLDKEKKAAGKGWMEEQQEELTQAKAEEGRLKDSLLNALRADLDDSLLGWLDAAVAIGEQRAFSPLLGGSGGAEGSMDLGVNFMDNLVLLISLETGKPLPDASPWLESSLFDVPTVVSVSNTAGSLLPERIGGPNAGTGFSSSLPINPWDYVLMLEGAVFIRPAMTKRLENGKGAVLSYPFGVAPTGSGAPQISTKDEQKTRSGMSELWMPLWQGMASHAELGQCFREGSINRGTSRPRSGLDFARAIAHLGADRGISGFQRFQFLKRSGDNDVAVPLERYRVHRNPTADVIADLDRGGWLNELRSFSRDKKCPSRLLGIVRRLEDSLFALTREAADTSLQEILCLLGELHLTLADSAKGREAVWPVARISPAWVSKADDGSPAFRIAAALAGIYAKNLPMRAHLLPIDEKGGWLGQGDARRALTIWGGASLSRNLIAIQRRRLIDTQRQGLERKPFESRLHASLADVAAFLGDPGMDAAISRLLPGLVLCELPEALPPVETVKGVPLPAAYAVLRALFTPDRALGALGLLPEGGHLPLPAEIPALLAAGQGQRALDVAWRRLRASGFPLPDARRPPAWLGGDPQRLAAALTIPLAFGDTARLLRHIAQPQEQTL